MNRDQLSEQPCPICGEKNYEWGTLRGNSLHYSSDEVGFFKRNLSMKYKLLARCCKTCRNVQIFDGN